ncbi:hypothetical protein JAAARDRAFT_30773 [Jaapia argillacea MUCL 33604]|uniref:Mediator of RNA polymerase II transcription subunit 4 n=1 Tax=Jaapia argillacea MUCL 33604 TaxID=933084 RepID=A0A067QFG9_9AGAM|nr:hypothetical protein JAAARDRAFT_30773 [Jaapia argillacea MUCL 33604]
MSQSRAPSMAPPGLSQSSLQPLSGPTLTQQTSDPATMTSTLLGPLSTLQSLSNTLFLSMSPSQKPPPAPPLSAFLAVDAELASALALARTHQIKQRRIEALKDEILELDRKWREVCEVLEKGRRELEEMIREGEERIEAIQKAKEGSIPYPELLAYAQSLSAFTSAPPNMPLPEQMLPGAPPPPLFFPPFPNEEKMRRGRMNAEAPLGLLGETHEVGKPPTASPQRGAEQPQHMGPVANPYRPDQRPPQQQFFDLDLDLNPDL